MQEVVKEMVPGNEGDGAVAQNWCKVGAKGGANLVQEVVKEIVR